jgi:hypothetical protein
MARSPLDDVATAAQDAAYVSLGLGVLAFQRLQVRRHELHKALAAQGGEARGALELVETLIGERLKMLEERVGAALGSR